MFQRALNARFALTQTAAQKPGGSEQTPEQPDPALIPVPLSPTSKGGSEESNRTGPLVHKQSKFGPGDVKDQKSLEVMTIHSDPGSEALPDNGSGLDEGQL